jgi:hypothetical protein
MKFGLLVLAALIGFGAALAWNSNDVQRYMRIRRM